LLRRLASSRIWSTALHIAVSGRCGRIDLEECYLKTVDEKVDVLDARGKQTGEDDYLLQAARVARDVLAGKSLDSSI
jgi:hypothetical protein